MDLLKTIRELHEEKKRLDRVIASLEQLVAEGREPGSPLLGTPSRRGRKHMNPEERRQVSERMARYWAARRAAKAAEQERAAGAAS